VVKIGNITSNGIEVDKIEYYSFIGLEKYIIRKGDILIAMTGATVGKMCVSQLNNCLINQRACIIRGKTINNAYLSYLLKAKEFYDYCQNNAGGGAQGNISPTQILNYKIPLPPLEVQEQIVAEIETYQKIIDGARQVIENWKPKIKVDEKWEMVKLGEYIDFVSGLTLSIPECESKTGIPIISINNILEDGKLTKKGLRFINIPSKCTVNYLQKGDLLFNWRNGSKHLVGKTGFFDWNEKYVFASFCLGIRTKTKYLDSRYLWYVLNNYRLSGKFMAFMRQNINGLFNREELKILQIQLPPLAVQQNIVSEIEKEQEIIEANKRLIELMEKKIEDVIAKVYQE
ncbi:MAG: restriction endonuclease subunit S, partial [Prevotellaceae bacterium]|nr:restriction endonuclease subunit S [Prevotellaceae bacterium]